MPHQSTWSPLSLLFNLLLLAFFLSTKSKSLTCRNAGTSSYLSLTVGIGAVSLDGSADRKALRSKAGSNASAAAPPAAAPALAAAAAPPPPPPPPPPFIVEGKASSARDLGRGGAIRPSSPLEESLERKRERREAAVVVVVGRPNDFELCSALQYYSSLEFGFSFLIVLRARLLSLPRPLSSSQNNASTPTRAARCRRCCPRSSREVSSDGAEGGAKARHNG